MDVAVGALVKGDTWQKAAAGAYVQRWTTAMRNLRAKRAGKGTTYVRIAHEMNGNWMAWGVNASNLAAFKAGYRLYASIVRKEFPQARLTFSPNGGNHSNVSIDQLWPGNDVVDVIGPDIYDGYPNVTSQAIWNSVSTQWSAPGSPSGLAAWLQYAAGRGKPVALPEWGLPSGDDPAFIQGVHDQLAAAAARPGTSGNAGRVVYDCYFNAEDKFKIYSGPNTSAGATYAKLVWGS
jgi:beta-mannanase